VSNTLKKSASLYVKPVYTDNSTVSIAGFLLDEIMRERKAVNISLPYVPYFIGTNIKFIAQYAISVDEVRGDMATMKQLADDINDAIDYVNIIVDRRLNKSIFAALNSWCVEATKRGFLFCDIHHNSMRNAPINQQSVVFLERIGELKPYLCGVWDGTTGWMESL